MRHIPIQSAMYLGFAFGIYLLLETLRLAGDLAGLLVGMGVLVFSISGRAVSDVYRSRRRASTCIRIIEAILSEKDRSTILFQLEFVGAPSLARSRAQGKLACEWRRRPNVGNTYGWRAGDLAMPSASLHVSSYAGWPFLYTYQCDLNIERTLSHARNGPPTPGVPLDAGS